MRPVLRGPNPRTGDYENYREAFEDLAGRIGMYCSYCERYIPTQLAVEHIQPKALPQYAHLTGRWDNFLLGCVNCNSTKGKKDVVLAEVLLPDRDNTAAAYLYAMDGRIVVSEHVPEPVRTMARKTLEMVGLDKQPRDPLPPNESLVAKDRYEQRLQAWSMAQDCRNDYLAGPSEELRRMICRLARVQGFFSIWMAVFAEDVAIRKLLIDTFEGTAADCFDETTSLPVSPRPATELEGGSKI